MDIVWSCLSTLFICLWTMLHLNLPAPDDGRWAILWRKARWLLLGVLAPELPMLFAFAQWASAKRSVVDMHNLGFTETEWTLVHAFDMPTVGVTYSILLTRKLVSHVHWYTMITLDQLHIGLSYLCLQVTIAVTLFIPTFLFNMEVFFVIALLYVTFPNLLALLSI